jgi:hypothetical protein
MVTRTPNASGNNSLMKPSVITTSSSAAGSANQTVPAVYKTTPNQAQPSTSSPTTVKSTPENVHRMVTALRDSLYPSQREWAAQSLSAADWRSHPEVIQALTTAARDDPAATVRAGCVRCLTRMKANTAPVLSVVRDLRKDADPRVRQEAEQALYVLTSGAK